MLRIHVNGRDHDVDCPDDEPLAYVLRNRLGLYGTKLACGLEQCGACLVIVDGEPRFGCTLPVGDCVGGAVVTIEGLGDERALHAVQRALLAHNAAQCGYCLSGIAVRAAALFAHDPHPHRDAIRAALVPQLCRCGAHPRVLRALQALSEEG